MASFGSAGGARRIEAVLFDKDGTLFDFEATWRSIAERALSDLAGGERALYAKLGRAVGFDVETGAFTPGSPLVSGSAEDVADRIAEELPGVDRRAIVARADAAALEALDGALSPSVPDLPGFLDGLRADGMALGVATHDGEAAARAHLASVGALDRFDFVCGYDSGLGLKPGPGMVLAFAQAVGAHPARIAMVGDSLHDLGAARAAGAGLAVGVLTGPARAEDLAPLADHILPSIASLPALLRGLAGAG